ncbi:hypothetical protein [Clostridium saccharoperbutylacetonicum]
MIKIHEKKYIKVAIIVAIVFAAIILIKSNSIFRQEQASDYTLNSKENTTEITGEITKNLAIKQEIEHLYGSVNSIELQFASFNNRNNKGTVNVKISSEDKILADRNYDVSKIKDEEFVKVPFDKTSTLVDQNIVIEISSPDSKDGSAVTMWMSEKNNNNGKLVISGKENKKMLNLKINYESPKFNSLIWGICIFILWLMMPIGIYKKLYNKYLIDENFKKSVKKYCCYMMLLILAFGLICLRDLNFLTKPIIYAEDGVYISNIFHNGFINSIFTTRSGQASDFQNSGSYLFLYFAMNLSEIFHGYNLSYLPTYIGIVSNLFLATVALVTYVAIKTVDKIMALIAYFCVILVPVGMDGAEIFGRTLNTVFIWPVFAGMLLIILYRHSYKRYYVHIIISFLCLLSCLSFPVTYGIVGIYLFFTFLRMILNKEKKLIWLLNNSILLINMVVGIYLLPSLLKSEGVTSTLTMKKDSIIEFAIARHVLYPFIYLIYKYFNNSLTIFVFVVYLLIILYALYLQIKNKHVLTAYSIILAFTFIYWIASVGMRIKMTALFDNYKSSFPDRYFYGCNILFAIVMLYSLKIIFDEIRIKKHFIYTCQTVIIVIMLVNPYLFQMAKPDIALYGGSYSGTFNERVAVALKEQNAISDSGIVKVKIYPTKEWNMDIPYIYARETANAVNK